MSKLLPPSPPALNETVANVPSQALPLAPETIAKRAYEKFLARGCAHGCDEADWLAAEQELVAKTQTDQ